MSWPLDPCAPKFAKGKPCDKERVAQRDGRAAITVWKFALPSSRSVLSMPKLARVLGIGAQNSEIVLWAEVNPTNDREDRVFNAVNTGAQLPSDRKSFLGTVTVFDSIVWHVYEVER